MVLERMRYRCAVQVIDSGAQCLDSFGAFRVSGCCIVQRCEPYHGCDGLLVVAVAEEDAMVSGFVQPVLYALFAERNT